MVVRVRVRSPNSLPHHSMKGSWCMPDLTKTIKCHIERMGMDRDSAEASLYSSFRVEWRTARYLYRWGVQTKPGLCHLFWNHNSTVFSCILLEVRLRKQTSRAPGSGAPGSSRPRPAGPLPRPRALARRSPALASDRGRDRTGWRWAPLHQPFWMDPNG